MNERIQQLAEQAGFKSSGELFGQPVPEYAVPLEKFAQLIVRECIGVIGEENYTMLTGKAYCAQLKRHFGVEE